MLDWQAVRRNLNSLADRHATRGVRWARECRLAGAHQLRERYGAVAEGGEEFEG